jgi:hypothetical protein
LLMLLRSGSQEIKATPLFLALSQKNESIFELLLEAGANPNEALSEVSASSYIRTKENKNILPSNGNATSACFRQQEAKGR